MTEYKETIYESIIRDMSEGIMTINCEGIIDLVNPAAEQVLGKSRDEILGKQYAKVFLNDKANDIFNQIILDAIYDPQTRHSKIVPWHNGDRIRQLYMVTSMLLHEGRKIGVIIMFGDVTELMELKVRYARDVEALIDSLVKALSTAIDERSHYNGNHTRNMVKMAEAFLDWMEENGNPWQYDELRRREFIMSVALHDVGKLTVPAEIMDKATRLGPTLAAIQDRFTRVKLLSRIAALEGRISSAQHEKNLAEAEETLAFICRVNKGGFLSDEDLQKVLSLASRTFEDENGEMSPLLTEGEITKLSIRKGTLTPEERSLMQGHAFSTWNILNQVHFPAQYAHVPLWAASHHQLLNATGYGKGLAGPDIPREVRMLTILDIFEALTAKDRPYKPPMPLEKAWTVLDSMVQEGALDGEILSAFRQSHAWERILK